MERQEQNKKTKKWEGNRGESRAEQENLEDGKKRGEQK